MTARELLALRTGARIVVQLANGRRFEAQVIGDPWVTTARRPGLHRVQVPVVDVEHAARIDAASDRVRGRSWSPFSPMAKAKHDIPGDRVISIHCCARHAQGEGRCCPTCKGEGVNNETSIECPACGGTGRAKHDQGKANPFGPDQKWSAR